MRLLPLLVPMFFAACAGSQPTARAPAPLPTPSPAEAATAHGSCKVDHADENGDKTHAHFVLACARGGPLELQASLDDKSGKVSDVKLAAPSEHGKRCP